jgi:predicted ABC-type sugar transport system permease subunit
VANSDAKTHRLETFRILIALISWDRLYSAGHQRNYQSYRNNAVAAVLPGGFSIFGNSLSLRRNADD